MADEVIWWALHSGQVSLKSVRWHVSLLPGPLVDTLLIFAGAKKTRLLNLAILLIAFDEEERILIVSFLPKLLSRVLWTSAAGIDRDAMRFQRFGAILDRLFTVPYFSWDFRDSKASIERQPSLFVRASATWGECLKYRAGTRGS